MCPHSIPIIQRRTSSFVCCVLFALLHSACHALLVDTFVDCWYSRQQPAYACVHIRNTFHITLAFLNCTPHETRIIIPLSSSFNRRPCIQRNLIIYLLLRRNVARLFQLKINDRPHRYWKTYAEAVALCIRVGVLFRSVPQQSGCSGGTH